MLASVDSLDQSTPRACIGHVSSRVISSRLANRTCCIGGTSAYAYKYAYTYAHRVRDIRRVTIRAAKRGGINLNALSLSARAMTNLIARNRFSHPSRVSLCREG